MNIRPSASIRQNYNEISELCKKSGEPVYLTKNGEGDLVVVKKQVEANEGDIVVALVDNQNTLKRYFRDDENKKIILHP